MPENNDSSSSGINRRLKPRYAVDVKVEMLTQGLDHYVVEKCANVSLGGLFVCTDYSAKENERVHVRIILSDQDAYFDIKTEVAWVCGEESSHPKGLGLRFVDINEQQQAIIDRFFKKYVNIQSDS